MPGPRPVKTASPTKSTAATIAPNAAACTLPTRLPRAPETEACAAPARPATKDIEIAMRVTDMCRCRLQAVCLEQSEPDLAHRGERRHRMPEPVERHLTHDRDRGRVQ